MPGTVSDVMTRDPVTVSTDTTLVDTARLMRDRDIGPVVVVDSDTVRGIVTDRDIVVRAVADGADPSSVSTGDICTSDVATVSPGDSLQDAVQLMEQRNVRRLPVVEDGRLVGIVAMGDLAVEGELPESAIADISAASPNN
jgi:CBS domain-containing protein